jgi:hypothetical protein
MDGPITIGSRRVLFRKLIVRRFRVRQARLIHRLSEAENTYRENRGRADFRASPLIFVDFRGRTRKNPEAGTDPPRIQTFA